jgi:hypothetical protein
MALIPAIRKEFDFAAIRDNLNIVATIFDDQTQLTIDRNTRSWADAPRASHAPHYQHSASQQRAGCNHGLCLRGGRCSHAQSPASQAPLSVQFSCTSWSCTIRPWPWPNPTLTRILYDLTELENAARFKKGETERTVKKVENVDKWFVKLDADLTMLLAYFKWAGEHLLTWSRRAGALCRLVALRCRLVTLRDVFFLKRA